MFCTTALPGSMELHDQLQETLGAAYTLDRELGGGGMSRVFVATETALGRQIVVKVMPPDSAGHMSLERFKREIKLAASLQHPHIVPLLSAGESHGLPFYTMPFVKGESLRERLVKGELSVKDTIHVLHDVASALAYAHREGIVHRDIKPENIILSGGVAVVTDFGVSKALNVATSELSAASEGLTSLGVALGTPAYMSPEQASADPRIDHRADIYAFGCVAYELLVGTSPFAGRTPQQMLAAHMTETPAPVLSRRASVPPALSALVSKCLEKSAGDRPQSADELLAALDAIATPSGGMEPTSVEARDRESRARTLGCSRRRGDRRCGRVDRRDPAVHRSRRRGAEARAGDTDRDIAGARDESRDLARRQARHLHGGLTRQLTDLSPADRRTASGSPDRRARWRSHETGVVARRFADRVRGERTHLHSSNARRHTAAVHWVGRGVAADGSHRRRTRNAQSELVAGRDAHGLRERRRRLGEGNGRSAAKDRGWSALPLGGVVAGWTGARVRGGSHPKPRKLVGVGDTSRPLSMDGARRSVIRRTST